MATMPPPTMPPPTMAPPMARRVGASDAGRGERLLAAIIDTACFIMVYLIPIVFKEPFLFFIALGGLVLYQIRLLSSRGQSIGKRVMSIKIVKVDTGENGGFVPNVLLRGIVNGLIGLLPLYAIVDTLFIFRDDKRCIHDLIAGTRVVNA